MSARFHRFGAANPIQAYRMQSTHGFAECIAAIDTAEPIPLNGVVQVRCPNRQQGNPVGRAQASRARNCPRNCKRRVDLHVATGFAPGRRSKTATRESGNLPGRSPFPRTGCAFRGGLCRLGDRRRVAEVRTRPPLVLVFRQGPGSIERLCLRDISFENSSRFRYPFARDCPPRQFTVTAANAARANQSGLSRPRRPERSIACARRPLFCTSATNRSRASELHGPRHHTTQGSPDQQLAHSGRYRRNDSDDRWSDQLQV